MPISRVMHLVRYIHKQLIDGKYLDSEGTEVILNINFDAIKIPAASSGVFGTGVTNERKRPKGRGIYPKRIKRTVMYNDYYFGLIGDTIHLLRDFDVLENRCTIDDKLRSIIRDFCQLKAVS